LTDSNLLTSGANGNVKKTALFNTYQLSPALPNPN